LEAGLDGKTSGTKEGLNLNSRKAEYFILKTVKKQKLITVYSFAFNLSMDGPKD